MRDREIDEAAVVDRVDPGRQPPVDAARGTVLGEREDRHAGDVQFVQHHGGIAERGVDAVPGQQQGVVRDDHAAAFLEAAAR